MESLIFFQEDINTRISKAYTNIKKASKERKTKGYLEGRLESLEQLWFEFMAGHKKIMCASDPKQLRNLEYVTNDYYDQTEEIYRDCKCYLKDSLSAFDANQPGPSGRSSTFEGKVRPEIKLPKINIPTFSGNYSEWSTFRDLYVSLIHKNDGIANVQKLHYLKGYLSGEAEQIVRHIPIVDTNYERCWKLLEERFDNKKYISHQVLKRFLSQRNLSTESASGLKDLIDTTNDCLASLSNIGIDVKNWDILVIHILTLKLDSETKRQWEFNVSTSNGSDELPSYCQFQEFITNRYRAIEFLDTKQSSGSKGINNNKIQGNNSNQSLPVNKFKSLHVAQKLCIFCSEHHSLGHCKKFVLEPVDARRKFVRDRNLCFNCMGDNHSAKDCRNRVMCRICKRKHHSLLHPRGEAIEEGSKINSKRDTSNEDVATSSETKRNVEGATASISCFSTGTVFDQGVLPTAVVTASSKNGISHTIRALLDQGSQSSFITESAAQYLRLKRSPVRGLISRVGDEQELISKAVVDLEVGSKIDPKATITVKAYVLKTITGLLPSNNINTMEWKEFMELPLADPEFHTPNRIDLLLGAGFCSKILQTGVMKNRAGTLAAQSTTLGWIVSGEVSNATTSQSENTKVLHCKCEEIDLLKRFWELETDEVKEKIFTEEERSCEEYFSATTQRDSEGRYVVRLPLNSEKPEVTGSREIAGSRLKALERRLDKDEYLKMKYKEVLNEYLMLNHMELVPIEEKENSRAVYLPHHAVIREDKTTSKVRVVFDASCKGKNKTSLNDYLMVGPTLQMELRHIITRWRTSPICLSADIVKMYRQVVVDKQDTDLQRILWREDTASEIKEYRLLRVTFGTASAPYLAVKALQQVALDEGAAYPSASEKVITDFYMDDLLTGCQNKEEGITIYKEMNELLGKAGLELQKWTTNDDDLLEKMIGSERSGEGKEEIKIKSDNVTKVVGLTWSRREDTFSYSVKLPDLEQPVTKRKIISDVSRFYDPLGWAGPSTIISKMMIQKLWLAGIDWDEEVPDQLLKEWQTYREELALLSHIHIPRWMGTKASDKLIELHGFCDASKVAYAAVVYIRVVDSNEQVQVALVAAKTKVAPVKQVSIPRLELCGAVLVTRLLREIAKVMKIDHTHLHAWTDSTVVLSWLNGHPNRWKVFVANRVSEILETLDTHHWSHVGTKQNPADFASRGLHPSNLLKNELWFNGPAFLKQLTINYEKPKMLSTNLEEIIPKTHCATVQTSLLERFSSLTRMIRVLAYCRRFANNARKSKGSQTNGHLSTKELNDVLIICIRQNQSSHFSEELDKLQKKKTLPANSKLRSLNPYLDEANILRVGGRLEHSQLGRNRIHPIIMPKQSYLTQLLISDAHKQTLHGGPQLTSCYLRSKYWVIGGTQLVKAHYRKCVTCVKNNAVTKKQLMGQAPPARVTPTRAFESSGTDFAGPIQIRTAKGRGHKSYKGYICLFVCMATKAIHLEVVSDLTSQGFLQAFKRFVARRGHCLHLWSDNATNFLGASTELNKQFKAEQQHIQREIAESLATNNCEWHFIPPHSPNFGGLWEAGVKSVKYHLKRVVGDSTLTYEELATVLAQIECCLNSRPQSVLNDDPNNVHVLTPGHFLIGEALITAPDYTYESSKVGSLRRWQYTQRMLQDFWTQWSRDYLTKFFQRYRWSSVTSQPKIGDVVIIKEDGLPPSRWLYGRVIDTHPGTDGIARVVTLRVKNGTIKRPSSKLCLLPVTQ